MIYNQEQRIVVRYALEMLIELLKSPTSADRDADPLAADRMIDVAQGLLDGIPKAQGAVPREQESQQVCVGNETLQVSAECIGKTLPPKEVKNVLGTIAVSPFYIWANGDCDSKSNDFEIAKGVRLDLINEGREEVYIVDANGTEVADDEVVAHEALMKAGYFAGPRKPEVKPEFRGTFMVNDLSDPEGYAIVGDDVGELILEAHRHLIVVLGPMEGKKEENQHA